MLWFVYLFTAFGGVGLLMGINRPCMAQSAQPCAEATARQGAVLPNLLLADADLEQMRPANACTVWATAQIAKRKYVLYAYTDGRIIDTIAQPKTSQEQILLRVPQGAVLLQLGPLEQGLAGTFFSATQGLNPARRQPFVRSMVQVGGLDILRPPSPDISPKQAASYNRLRYHLLGAGTYANVLMLLIRRVQYPCPPDEAGCCHKPPRQTYYVLKASVGPDGLPVLDNATLSELAAPLCPPPQPLCGPALQPWALEVPAGVLHTRQPMAYIGAGAWVINTGAALVRVSQEGQVATALPKNWHASQIWVEGILSDEATQKPSVLVRAGGYVNEAEAGQAFLRIKRFRIGSLLTLPLPELPKGTHAAQVGVLQLRDTDLLLERLPIGFAAGQWWLAGKGNIRPQIAVETR